MGAAGKRLCQRDRRRQFISVLKEWLDVDDAANPDAPGIKAYSMVYDDRQGCVLVLPGDGP